MLTTKKELCTGCHTCYSVCPKKAISMDKNTEGYLYPCVDDNLCIKCNLCNKRCPVQQKNKIENEYFVYAAYNKDEKTRMNSSSGGIFTLIAENVINSGGVVFGAFLNEENTVVHSYATTIDELKKFRGSKYVQSIIGDNYLKVKEFLDKDIKVLFTGTPCQVGGLLSYLGKEYSNLITQDIICHGVPSDKVFKKYLDFQNRFFKGTIREFSFRSKLTGWKKFAIKFETDEDQYVKNLNDDYYMRAFLSDVCLRSSCYQCSFKTKNRISDITLADFWGVQEVLPHMDDDKGTSLVILNSNKGKTLFECVKGNTIFENVDLDIAITHNQAMIHSAKINKNRDAFFKDIDKMEFDDLVNKHSKKSKIKIIFTKIKRIPNKLRKLLFK